MDKKNEDVIRWMMDCEDGKRGRGDRIEMGSV